MHENLFGINKFCYSEWLFNANEMRKWCTEHRIFSVFWSVNTLYYCYCYYYYHNSCFTIMQDIYNYVPITNHVSTVHNCAAVLCLQIVLHVMLFRPWIYFIRYCFCCCCCCCYCCCCHLHNDVCYTDYTFQTVGW